MLLFPPKTSSCWCVPLVLEWEAPHTGRKTIPSPPSSSPSQASKFHSEEAFSFYSQDLCFWFSLHSPPIQISPLLWSRWCLSQPRRKDLILHIAWYCYCQILLPFFPFNLPLCLIILGGGKLNLQVLHRCWWFL